MDDSNESIRAVEAQLAQLARLMGYLVAETQENLTDKAVVLRRLGLGQKVISEICGTTSNTISVRLAEAKRRAKKKSK